MLKTENKLYETPDMKVYQINLEAAVLQSSITITSIEDAEELDEVTL